MSLKVTVLNPEKTMFQGNAKAIGTVNDQGKLSLLPGHANMISLIKEGVTIHPEDESQKPQTIPLEQGVLYCHQDTVEIYLGISAASPESSSSS